MEERYRGSERRSKQRRADEALECLSSGVRAGINKRLDFVLSGQSRKEVFSALAAAVMKERAFEIKSRCAVATIHRGSEDLYGRAYQYRDRQDVHQFHFEPVRDGDVFKVQSLCFETTPEAYASVESVLDRARSGKLGFEPVATPIMAVDSCVNGIWHGMQMVPSGTVEYHPMARYGQSIFGGNRALRLANGEPGLFRPDMHAARFWRNAERTMMPRKSDGELIEMFEETARANAEYIPDSGEGSMYLAPEFFAHRRGLGVKPGKGFILACYGNPAGSIFKGPVSILVERDFHRAVEGGVGDVKVSGNYVGGMQAVEKAKTDGFGNIVCLDSQNQRFLETPVSSFFVVDTNGVLRTAPLDGLILDSITRDSIIKMVGELEKDCVISGFEEGVIPVRELHGGKIREAFLCGTGATVTPISSLTDYAKSADPFEMAIGADGMGPVTARIDGIMKEIFAGERNDSGPYAGWIRKVV